MLDSWNGAQKGSVCDSLIIDYDQFHSSRSEPLIESVSVENYKCFQRLNLSNATLINIVTGRNGAGKTALIEAISAASSGAINEVWNEQAIRGLPKQIGQGQKNSEAWRDLFHNFDFENEVKIEISGRRKYNRKLTVAAKESFSAPGTDKQGNVFEQGPDERVVQFLWHDTDKNVDQFSIAGMVRTPFGQSSFTWGDSHPVQFSKRFVSGAREISSQEAAQLFSNLEREKGQPRSVGVLKELFPEIGQVKLFLHNGQPGLEVQKQAGTRFIPLPLHSYGVKKILSLLLAMESEDLDVLLADEIENGIHYSLFASFWQAVYVLAKERRTQIFATSHSRECISALLGQPELNPDDITIYQVDQNNNGEVNIQRISGEDAVEAEEYGADFR